jgi:hypothetical protein
MCDRELKISKKTSKWGPLWTCNWKAWKNDKLQKVKLTG